MNENLKKVWVTSVTNYMLLSAISVSPVVEPGQEQTEPAPFAPGIYINMSTTFSEVDIINHVNSFLASNQIGAELYLDDPLQVIHNTPEFKAYSVEIELDEESDLYDDDESTISIYIQTQLTIVPVTPESVV